MGSGQHDSAKKEACQSNSLHIKRVIFVVKRKTTRKTTRSALTFSSTDDDDDLEVATDDGVEHDVTEEQFVDPVFEVLVLRFELLFCSSDLS